MQLLLSLLFAVSVLSPEPILHPPALNHFGEVNTYEWDTHDEGWDKVFALPVQHPGTYAEQTSESSDVFRGMGSDVEQWRPLVAGQFPPEQLENALCVIKSESGGNPNAKNPHSNARGLFQVMSSVWGPYFGFTHADFYVPELNVYAAARIWERSGWQPWSPRTRRICGL